MINRVISAETRFKMSKSAIARLEREGKLSHFEGKKHTPEALNLLRTAALKRRENSFRGYDRRNTVRSRYR